MEGRGEKYPAWLLRKQGLPKYRHPLPLSKAPCSRLACIEFLAPKGAVKSKARAEHLPFSPHWLAATQASHSKSYPPAQRRGSSSRTRFCPCPFITHGQPR
jgi:hypothetical protein